MNAPPPEKISPVLSPWRPHLKVIVLLLALLAGGFFFRYFGDTLTMESVEGKEAWLRATQLAAPIRFTLAAILVYVATAALSLPFTTILTILFAWFFGFWQGLLLVSFSSTAGATIAFLVSRFLFREAIQRKFGDHLKAINEAFARDGPFYLFTLRLIPLLPFSVINLVMGLTSIRTRTFWWVSQLGMIGGTAACAYAGSSLPSLTELGEGGSAAILSPRLIVALALLGLFPLATRKLITRVKAKRASP